jgi:hypothetical protein
MHFEDEPPEPMVLKLPRARPQRAAHSRSEAPPLSDELAARMYELVQDFLEQYEHCYQSHIHRFYSERERERRERRGTDALRAYPTIPPARRRPAFLDLSPRRGARVLRHHVLPWIISPHASACTALRQDRFLVPSPRIIRFVPPQTARDGRSHLSRDVTPARCWGSGFTSTSSWMSTAVRSSASRCMRRIARIMR